VIIGFIIQIRDHKRKNLMKQTEELTASLYEEVHPYSDTSQITSDYIFSLNKGDNFFDNKDVLDCGFGGTGWAIKLFCNQGAKSVTGIDLNLTWVQKIEKEIGTTSVKLELLEGNILYLPFDNNSFDYVHSYGVIHHTTDWAKAISEMLRVCRENGNVFFMVYGRFGVLGNAVHKLVRLLGRIVPKKWAFFVVHKFHFFENHEFSILDVMYVPIELHFSEVELLSELSKYKLKSIDFLESEKIKNSGFLKNRWLFGDKFHHLVLIQK